MALTAQTVYMAISSRILCVKRITDRITPTMSWNKSPDFRLTGFAKGFCPLAQGKVSETVEICFHLYTFQFRAKFHCSLGPDDSAEWGVYLPAGVAGTGSNSFQSNYNDNISELFCNLSKAICADFVRISHILCYFHR